MAQHTGITGSLTRVAFWTLVSLSILGWSTFVGLSLWLLDAKAQEAGILVLLLVGETITVVLVALAGWGTYQLSAYPHTPWKQVGRILAIAFMDAGVLLGMLACEVFFSLNSQLSAQVWDGSVLITVLLSLIVLLGFNPSSKVSLYIPGKEPKPHLLKD